MATSNIREYIEKNKTFEITDLGTLIRNGVIVAMTAGALLCLAYLIWGGIEWITSAGEKSQYEAARNKITHALIGLALVAASWAIWLLILKFFGLGTQTDTGVEFDLGT